MFKLELEFKCPKSYQKCSKKCTNVKYVLKKKILK